MANQYHPDIVVDVHRSYIDVGAQMIHTNTFVASPLHLEMADPDADTAQIARLAAALARRAVEESCQDVYVAGSLGPSPEPSKSTLGTLILESQIVKYAMPTNVWLTHS